MSIHREPIHEILEQYSDVITGADSARHGIPGFYFPFPGASADEIANGYSLSPVDTGSTTSFRFTYESNLPDSSDYYYRVNDSSAEANGFSMFIGDGDGDSPSNDGVFRKIVSYSTVSSTVRAFGLLSAMPAAASSSDNYRLRAGFGRIPDALDIEDDLETSSFDRTFRLSALPGEVTQWKGSGNVTCRTKLELRLRLLKYGRSFSAVRSAFSNLSIIRAVICRGDLRGDYVRALLAEGNEAKIIKEDKNKIVAMDTFTLIYRMSATYL